MCLQPAPEGAECLWRSDAGWHAVTVVAALLRDILITVRPQHSALSGSQTHRHTNTQHPNENLLLWRKQLLTKIYRQISEMISVTFVRWTKLGCARWLSTASNCWISSIQAARLSMSSALSGVSRGRRENMLSTSFNRATATPNYSSFSVAEASLISTNSSAFSPRNSRI